MANKQVTYTISLKDSLTAGLNNANNAAKRLEGSLTSATSKGSGFFGSMVKFNILQNVASAAFGAAKNFFQMSSDMEQSNVAFEVLLGSADKAKTMLADMKKFADKTPFEFKDLQAAGKTMLGFQIPATKIMSTLKNLGDVSMGDSNKLQSMTLAFSQMSATGKLMGQDLNQMINAGFNPLGEMARTSGKSVAYFKDQMSKGAISSDMVAKAFESATAKGGPFFGMMEKMSQTTSGRLSTLKDTVNTIGMNLMNSLLPAINTGMSWLSELFSKFGQIKQALQPLIDLYVEAYTAIFGSLKDAVGGVDLSIDGLINGLKVLVEWIKPLVEAITEVMSFIWINLMEILKPLFPVFELIMGAIHILFNVIKVVLRVVMVALRPVIAVLKGVATVIGWIAQLIMGAWKLAAKLIEKFMELEWVKTLFGAIKTAIEWVSDGLTWLYNNTLGPIIDGIMAAVDAIKEALGMGTKVEAVKFTKEDIEKGVADRNSKEGKAIAMAVAQAQKNPKSPISKKILEEATKAGWFSKGDKGAEGDLGATGALGKNLKSATSPSSVKSNAPNIITVTIGKLIEDFTIETTNITESYSKIKELVAKALIEACNDVSTTQ